MRRIDSLVQCSTSSSPVQSGPAISAKAPVTGLLANQIDDVKVFNRYRSVYKLFLG